MAEGKINGNLKINDGSTDYRTLKELNNLVTTLNTNLINLINKRKILYNNPAGSIGNITLSEKIDGYKYIEISGFANSDDNPSYKTSFSQRFRRISRNISV